MSAVIYYFTGTGNSLKVAKDMVERLDAKLVKISASSLENIKDQEEDCIGIVFPVYYYGMPLMVKEFVKKLSIKKGTYVFSAVTCGGSVGATMKQLKQLFYDKGVELSAAFSIVMPDNYQVLYGPPAIDKQEKCFKAQEEITLKIAEKIKNREKVKFHEEGKYFTKAFGSMFSRSFKPYEKDKNFWTDENCNGCSICSKVCPADNIAMTEGKPDWKHKCDHCLACMQWCPKKSIQYKRGTLKRDRYHHPKINVRELMENK